MIIPDFKDRCQHIPGNHGADAQGQAADAAHQGEDNATHGQAADEGTRMVDEVRRQYQNRHHIGIHDVHVHADGHIGKAHGNDDEGRRKTAESCRNRRAGGENALDIGLGAEDADDDREKIGHGRFKSPAKE